MAEYRVDNGEISIKVNSFGAELKSLQDCNSKLEYMWNADPKFWKRTSPILFPIVGSLKNNEYTYESVTYPMSQHGFARDMEFELTEKSEKKISFVLNSNEETIHKYPFNFCLQVTYILQGRQVVVQWKIVNTSEKKMYFSIGAHPAFMCPIHTGTKQSEYTIKMDAADKVISTKLGAEGLVTTQKRTYFLENGCLPITEELFDEDALVIEHHQAQKVALLDQDQNPYVTVSFDAPIFGIWSPPKKKAPFICIEPWYGRCDGETFKGELKKREWGNSLEAGEIFETKYTIAI